MNDRELLELAAKAGGYEFDLPMLGDGPALVLDGMKILGLRLAGGAIWNPLTDDGDALRLAARIGMIVDVRYGERMKEMQCHNRITYWVTPSNGMTVDCDNPGSDNLASIRRAIVRAAAEIGRAMP